MAITHSQHVETNESLKMANMTFGVELVSLHAFDNRSCYCVRVNS